MYSVSQTRISSMARIPYQECPHPKGEPREKYLLLGVRGQNTDFWGAGLTMVGGEVLPMLVLPRKRARGHFTLFPHFPAPLLRSQVDNVVPMIL